MPELRSDTLTSVGSAGYRIGDSYTVLSMVTMREQEVLDSGIVCEIKAGNVVQVIELGIGPTGRRLKVSVTGQQGWISCETANGEALLSRTRHGAGAVNKKTGDLRSDTGNTIFTFTSSFLGRGSKKSDPLRGDTLATASTAATETFDPPGVGEPGETLSIATVRCEESLDSAIVCELPKGTKFTLEQMGDGRRARITTEQGQKGWLSVKTKNQEPLVRSLAPHANSVTVEDFQVGGQHETRSVVTMRETEAIDSGIVTDLKPGAILKILEFGQEPRRAKVEVNGQKGWISLTTRRGEPLVGPVTGQVSKEGGSSGCAEKVKALLEGARGGDLEAVMKVVNDRGSGLLSKFNGGVDINSSDVRGKTALTYAAAFGNKEIVQFLVQQKGIDVNSLDDTQKLALHHAAKKVRRKREDQNDTCQSDVVRILLQSGSFIEARDHNGCTALMFACTNGDLSVTKTLLEYGASVNTKDYEGHTSLDYARTFKHQHIVTLLKERGARGEDSEGEAAPASPAVAGGLPGPPGAEASECPEVKAKKKAKAKCKRKVKKEGTEEHEDGEDHHEEDHAAAEQPAAEEGAPECKKKPKAKVKAKGKGRAKAKADAASDDAGRSLQRKMSMSLKMNEEDLAAGIAVVDKSDAADPKAAIEQATKVLNQAVENAKSSHELENAIKVASAADVGRNDIHNAEKRLKALRSREKALDELQEAMSNLGSQFAVKRLKEKIDLAKKESVAAHHVAEAEAVLKDEIPKQDARDALKAAQDSGKADDLRNAVARAKAAGLDSEEWESSEELLRGAESKQAAEQALKEAIDTRHVAQLRFAIQQAQGAGVGSDLIAQAQEVFKVEEPRQLARDALEAALEALDVAAMEKAIEQSKKVGLDRSEYKEAEDAVESEKGKAVARKAIAAALESTKGIVLTDVDALSALKANLTVEIKKAREAGLKDDELSEVELRRRKIHNAIEDLKGSIRVFCRIRPLSSKEKGQGDTKVTDIPDPMTVTIGPDPSAPGCKFVFDAVFGPGTQQEVFNDCSDLVQSAVDGYNVTLFAYGQTGAGKTFTMYGEKSPGMEGVCPRTVQEVFTVTSALSDRYNFTILGSMIELYRNDLIDLLNKASPGSASTPKLNCRTAKTGEVVIENMTEHQVQSAQEFEKLLQEGEAQRTVAATAMNSASSRSHLIMICKIVSVNKDTKDTLRGKILLCDLAGSERLKKSEVTGDGQKEAIEINKSLTALGDVVEALTKKSKTIPYRNHKLTQVMQDSLGGTAKTLMFVNASPAASNTDETVMSLKWAGRAKKITNTSAKKKE